MPKGFKKVLTLDELVSFFKSPTQLTKFDANEFGYKLSVQTPAIFEIQNADEGDEDDSMFYGTIKAFHTEENRNGSYIPDSAAVKAMNSMKYRPILAYINNFGDDKEEDYDFTSHQIEIGANGELIYIESQVGCFTADQPYMQYDYELEKNFVYARVAIPRYYTRTADIIEKKGGTKVSVELSINEMSWDGNNNRLILEDFIVEGCTLLGRSMGEDDEYGAQVEEGMKGAKLILEDFKEDNNSVVKYSKESNNNAKLIETLEMLNQTLSNFYIDKNIDGKGECLMKVEIESLGEVVESVGVGNEIFDNTSDTTDVNADVAQINMEEDSTENTDAVEDDLVEEKEFDENSNNEFDSEEFTAVAENNDNVEPITDDDNNSNNYSSITFELSHDDIRCGLYKLLATAYPDEYLDIISVYDDHFIMLDWINGNFYSQSYIKDDVDVVLSGERVTVYAEFITESEKNALELMRNTYQSMNDELNSYKLKEAREQKINSVRDNNDYAMIKDSEEFSQLVNNMDEYSLDEFVNKADLILAKYAKASKMFSIKKNGEPYNNGTNFVAFSTINDEMEKASEPYGGIFKDILQRKNTRN